MYQFHVNDNNIQSSILLKIPPYSEKYCRPEVVAKSYDSEFDEIEINECLMMDQKNRLFPKSESYYSTIISENEDHRGKLVVVFRATTLGYFIAYDGIIRHYGIDSDGVIRALSMYM